MVPLTPRISVIIPVLHEAARINRAVEAIRDLEGGKDCEIIVADGDPDGTTLRAIGDRGVIRVTSRPGRGPQLNEGARLATGDILLFLHVDTFLPSAGLARIREFVHDRRYVGGAFRLSFDSDRLVHQVLAEAASLRSRLTRLPFGDQGIFVRRRYFEEIGGFRDFAIMEDVELMHRIRRRGDRIRILGERARTSPRRLDEEGIIYCLLRGIFFHGLLALGVSPQRLRRYYPLCVGGSAENNVIHTAASATRDGLQG